jgi:hypothetical protein
MDDDNKKKNLSKNESVYRYLRQERRGMTRVSKCEKPRRMHRTKFQVDGGTRKRVRVEKVAHVSMGVLETRKREGDGRTKWLTPKQNLKGRKKKGISPCTASSSTSSDTMAPPARRANVVNTSKI